MHAVAARREPGPFGRFVIFTCSGAGSRPSTRVIFAAAFDRVLPDAATQVSEKRRVPFASLVLMLLPAVGLGALYAYNTTFAQYTLDGVLVTAVTYLFSAIAVVILPLRKP